MYSAAPSRFQGSPLRCLHLRKTSWPLETIRAMQKEGVDIIHARSRAPAWVAYGAARRMNRAFVTTYHGAYSGKSSLKIFYNSVMARGDAVIANSSFTGHRIARLHPFAAGKIHVIPRDRKSTR